MVTIRTAAALTALACLGLPPSAATAPNAAPNAGPTSAARAGEVAPDTAAGPMISPVFRRPISTAACRARLRRGCYTPTQYRVAYNLNPLYAAGITGAGRTILIVDSFGSPTIRHDLDVYNRQFHLPPADLQVLRWGRVPRFNPRDRVMRDWAAETTLDVQAAHAIAPGARIILVETAVAETEGIVGVPEMMRAINHLVNADQADVVSMSWSTTESRFPGFARGDYRSLTSQRFAFANARRHGVTLVASSGDSGGWAGRLDASWPAGDPLVTAAGGTELWLNRAGRRLRPDEAWLGSGGGLSRVFRRPRYQDLVRGVVGGRRGVPDVSMAASPNGALWLYSSYDPRRRGWTASGGGTSESAPLLAAVVALADQAAGRRLGQFNQELYRAYARRDPAIVSVQAGHTGSHGYRARRGYNLATGVGTLDVARLVRTLAAGRFRSALTATRLP